MLIPFGLGNKVELRTRQAFPHLASHYAVLKYSNAWGNVLDGIPMVCFEEIKKRAVEGSREYLTDAPLHSVRSVQSTLSDMVYSFEYLHPGNSETLTLNYGSLMEII